MESDKNQRKCADLTKNVYAGVHVDDCVDEFVNVCLDFSIAQYMEDCSFWQTKRKDFAYFKKKQKNIFSQTY